MKSVAVLTLVIAACGGDDTQSTIDAPPMIDAQMADAGFGSTCSGTCATTSLTAAFQVVRKLDVAYFGITASDNTLHIESYKGAAAGCPTSGSPTPEYTLILGQVTRPSSAMTSGSPATILDFQGDLLGGPLNQGATTVVITPVAAMGDVFIALDLMMTFPSGTIMGHLYATHCASFDG